AAGTHEVAVGVVAAPSNRHRANTPAAKQLWTDEMTGTRRRLVVVDDSAPEQMPDVRRQRINLAFFSVKGQGKELLLWNPKVPVEFAFELSGFFLEPLGSLRVIPEF